MASLITFETSLKSLTREQFIMFTTNNCNSSKKKNRYGRLPKKPFYVVPSHFIVAEKLHKIMKIINNSLLNIREVSFEFNTVKYVWECVFIHSSTYSKFEFRLYEEGEKKIIVEGNRLKGDSAAFYTVYNNVKAAFTEKDYVACKSINAVGPVMPGISNNLTYHESLAALNPFLYMAEEKYIESKHISAEILCELAYHDDMLTALFSTYAIDILAKLLKFNCRKCCANTDNQNCECSTIKRYVILAIAELSNTYMFIAQIMQTPDLLRIIFKFATHGPYYTLHMRRAAATIIANCSTKGWANTIVNTIGKQSLKVWFYRTKVSIKDKILRNEIERTEKALKKVMIFS